MKRIWLFVPLLAFAALAAVLLLGFTLRDPHLLPSALLDRPFPPFDLPVLGEDGSGGEGRATREALLGEVRLVNVWATWCPTCLAEHDELKRIRKTGLSVVGINYKDDPENAVAWLKRHGDPYAFSVVDADGDLGVDLGVYGAPETFLVDADGVIRYKRVGEVDETVWREEIVPALELLR